MSDPVDPVDPSLNRNDVAVRYLGSLLKTIKPTEILTMARPTAYASEVGEAFRPIVHRYMVNSLYGLSIGYVLVDVGFKMHSKRENTEQMIKYGIDQTLWHSMASMIFPALTVHTVVSQSTRFIKPTAIKYFPRVGRFVPVTLGLTIIPFIIHPLDELGTFIMDNTYRVPNSLPEGVCT